MSKIRQGFCKAEAHKLLKSLWIESPDEIDLQTLAFKAGSLSIEEGGLENSDGRIVTTGDQGGVIRVKSGMHRGRKRFTIAHEIGHYQLHPKLRLSHNDESSNFRIWNDMNEEAEANMFAAELLMPEFLFKPKLGREDPSLATMDRLAEEFKTSTMATLFQYITYTKEPLAMVVSVEGRVKWRVQSQEFKPSITRGELHKYSGASEINLGKSSDTNGLVDTPAAAWLPFEDTDSDLKEDSRLLEAYGCVVTVLWLDDDL
ncbi:MAG: ImmA/IrrE family metallo-endopeptidase [Luteolibacter sp.]